jgi:short-subunit dehydrogenase
VNPQPLEGRAALVTGATSGLGEAFARALAGKGVHVFLVGRRQDRLRQTAEEIRAAGGVADAHVCDLRELPSVYDLIDIALSRLRRLDILVHAAGIGVSAPLLATRRTDIAETIETNLRAPMYLTQAALPALLKQAPSEIVFVGSVAGRRAAAEASVYCASKFGLLGFARSLALELAPARVRVTSLLPGAVDTPFFERFRTSTPREEMLSTQDASRILLQVLETPPHVALGEITLEPLV